MWPKAFAQLIELLPHVSRLIPMADNFFASRNAAQQAAEKSSHTILTDTLHNDLAQITAAHAGFSQQLADQSTRLAEIAADLKRSRIAIDRDAEQLATLEQKLGTLTTWVKSLFVLLILAIALLITIFVLAARVN